MRLGWPAVGPYCRPSASSAPAISIVASAAGSPGERDLMVSEVKGNVAALGLPASRDIMPGRASSGYRPRTARMYEEVSLSCGWQTTSKL